MVAIVLAAGALAAFQFSGRDSGLPGQLKRWGVQLRAAPSFELMDRDSQAVGKLMIEELVARQSPARGEQGSSARTRVLKIYRIAGFTLAEAERQFREKDMQFVSIYDQKPSPYFAILNEKIDCPAEFRPRISRSGSQAEPYVLYAFFANDRLTYGACTADTATYHATLANTICRTGNDGAAFYAISLFSPAEKRDDRADEELVRSFRCGQLL